MRLASSLDLFYRIEILFRGLNFPSFWFFYQKMYQKICLRQWIDLIHSMNDCGSLFGLSFHSNKIVLMAVQILKSCSNTSVSTNSVCFDGEYNPNWTHPDFHFTNLRLQFVKNNYFGADPLLPTPILILC